MRCTHTHSHSTLLWLLELRIDEMHTLTFNFAVIVGELMRCTHTQIQLGCDCWGWELMRCTHTDSTWLWLLELRIKEMHTHTHSTWHWLLDHCLIGNWYADIQLGWNTLLGQQNWLIADEMHTNIQLVSLLGLALTRVIWHTQTFNLWVC